jgi:16S rRNA (guanine(966)-N(2))-methyltransferase RsmD
MRVIAGALRGRTLRTLPDLSIRPVTDRVKQTIFDILSNRIDFQNIKVLDLFCGCGSFGIEAISRGAASAVFVDSAHRSIDVLNTNLATLNIREKSVVHEQDAITFLGREREEYDVIFADPPYKLDTIGSIPGAIYRSAVSRNGSLVVMEHNRASDIECHDEWYKSTVKSFGQTNVLILTTTK